MDDRPTGVQRTSEAQVIISVLRDSGPPTFVNTPYSTSVPINQQVNTTFYSVRAIDNDLKVIKFSFPNLAPRLQNFFHAQLRGGRVVRRCHVSYVTWASS